MKSVFVTQPFLPPLAEFTPYLEQIWESKILTNNGPFHRQFEAALCKHLEVNHLSLFTNATIALVTALQALRVTGEVITTPYSFVATAHSLLWNNIKPVFVDVAPNSFNLDPDLIEAAITPQTTAIMPVHCYGHPCDVKRIQTIADNYGLKVIYDAAHVFGVTFRGDSLLSHGDLAILSFHATKVFNTFEGGAIIARDERTKARIDHLKNFGFSGETTVTSPGINGKMSELNAAFGLLQLKYIDFAIAQRRRVDAAYREQLENIPGITVPEIPKETEHNYSYFPILVSKEYGVSRDELYDLLKEAGIYARRYFYPLITDFPMYRDLPSASRARLPQAAALADSVLCLPIYPNLSDEVVTAIVDRIRTARIDAC